MMATYGDMINAIADDVDDTQGEYRAQIERAIQVAIRYCERLNFWFNETRSKTFATVNGTGFYGASALADIATAPMIRDVFLVDGSGNIRELPKVEPAEIEVLSNASANTGEPYCWCYVEKQIRLYPIPDGVYNVRLMLTPYRLDALSADGDTNVWTDEAYDMVKARAKYVLAKDTQKDAEIAVEALNDFNDHLRELQAETSKRKGTGFIRPTDF